jgi:hypothetical protein
MRIGLHQLVVRSLKLISRSLLVVRVSFLNRLFGDTGQKKGTDADHASMPTVFRTGRVKVRVFIGAYQLVALTKTACDVGAVLNAC